MKKLDRKRLVLTSTTIRILDGKQLQAAAGGAVGSDYTCFGCARATITIGCPE
jgi:hypothetical protein